MFDHLHTTFIPTHMISISDPTSVSFTQSYSARLESCNSVTSVCCQMNGVCSVKGNKPKLPLSSQGFYQYVMYPFVSSLVQYTLFLVPENFLEGVATAGDTPLVSAHAPHLCTLQSYCLTLAITHILQHSILPFYRGSSYSTYLSCHLTGTHFVQEIKISQGAAFHHLSYSTPHSFFLTRRGTPSICIFHYYHHPFCSHWHLSSSKFLVLGSQIFGCTLFKSHSHLQVLNYYAIPKFRLYIMLTVQFPNGPTLSFTAEQSLSVSPFILPYLQRMEAVY